MAEIFIVLLFVVGVPAFVGNICWGIARERYYRRGYAQAAYELRAFGKLLDRRAS